MASGRASSLLVVLALACDASRALPSEPQVAGAGAAGATSGGAGATSGGAGACASPAAGATLGGTSGVSAGASSDGGAHAGDGASGAPGGATGGATGGASLGSCEGKGSELAPWPGGAEVTTLEPEEQFRGNLSGLTYDPEHDALWAVDNLPGTLFRLVPSGDGFVTDADGGWASGKGLRYPDGASAPDSEGLTFAADASAIYACSEHDNSSASSSRQSVLRFALGGAGATLTATHDWNLTSILPRAGANTGVEAITWVPDSYLTARGFFDELAAGAYEPARYGDHGAGLFLVGVEESGRLYAVALDHASSAAHLVATIITPQPGVMGLEFDRDTDQLWFHCDDTCGNQSGILDIDTQSGSATLGRFVVTRQFERPAQLPDSNHEGIAIGPASACQDGFKPFFWTDDADAGGFSLRRGTIPCARCP